MRRFESFEQVFHFYILFLLGFMCGLAGGRGSRPPGSFRQCLLRACKLVCQKCLMTWEPEGAYTIQRRVEGLEGWRGGGAGGGVEAG